MLYKILKSGLFSEPQFSSTGKVVDFAQLNEVGKIVDLHPYLTSQAVVEGYLEPILNQLKKNQKRNNA